MRVVVLCGGSGTRLWPESRESQPKQFIHIFDKKSLLDLTIERVLHLNFNKKPVFIANKRYGFLIKKSLDKYNLTADLILEPLVKNTCAAIYLAAKHCSSNDDLLIMPADHFIPDKKAFCYDILQIKKNISSNIWVTLGIKPYKPSEAYGYIKISRDKNKYFQKVTKFIEKPNKAIAAKLIQDNSYYWNAGIFIANASTIMKSINSHAPNIAKNCDKAFNSITKNSNENQFDFSPNLFSKIPSESIDYAVMEKEKNLYLYPFIHTWNDVGSWDTVTEIKNMKSSENIIEIDSSENFIWSKKRIIATIGVKNLIIVDSDDATLISKKNNSEKVKLVVNKLIENNKFEAKELTFENRPWGKFEKLLENNLCKVKKLIVSPNKRLSLQYHNYRSEHWLVVFGTANVHLNGKNIVLNQGESIDIPVRSHHYVENKTTTDLIIIETQLGSYFGEDDIVRLDDPYFR